MKARSLKQITGLTFVLPGVMLIAAACGASPSVREVPMAVHIPSASEVAKQVSCVNFRDTGTAHVGGVVSSGTCFIGSTRYAIDTFPSMKALDHWLDLTTAFGLDVKWKTSTAVVYVSVHQPPAETTAFSSDSTAPLPKIAANTNGLHGQVRPDHVYIGQGNAPEAIYLVWGSYTHTEAYATGYVLWPSASASPRYLKLHVWRPVHYGGASGKFFTRMTWTWRSTTGHLRTVLFWFTGQAPQWPFWTQQ